jgi:mercuric ion transport protein
VETRTRRRLSEAGAITSAGTVAATIVCCLPFASGVVGAGDAAFGAQFAPLRPCFTGLSLASLGYAFYQTYRPGPARCDDGHCETPRRLRRRRLALFGITTLVLLLLSSSLWANWIIYWTL